MNIECNIPTREALVVICEHEKIPYTLGAGPSGHVFCVSDDDEKKFKKAIREWYDAIMTTVLSVG